MNHQFPVCAPAPKSSQDDAARLMALLQKQQGRSLRGPLMVFFSNPCGVWLSLDATLVGMPWRKTLVAMTRRTIFGGGLA